MPEVFKVTVVLVTATVSCFTARMAMPPLSSMELTEVATLTIGFPSSSLVLTDTLLLESVAYLVSLVLLLSIATAIALFTNSSRIGSSTPDTVTV